MEGFLQKNPGLRSRIAFHVPFADYSTDELCSIANLIAGKKGLKIEMDSRRVFIKGHEVSLTAKEFDLVLLLVSNPNKVYSRDELLNEIWGATYPGDARTVDVHVRRLREKIETKPADPEYIHTKWGVGYFFQD